MSSVPGDVVGLKFYKTAGNVGTHVGYLWTVPTGGSAGSVLASAPFVGETATGWQSVSFPSPVTIVANTLYLISYDNPSGHYAYSANYFATATTSSPITLPASASCPSGNGVYALSPGVYPTSSYSATNYFVDIIFDDVPSRRVPVLTWSNPADIPYGTPLDSTQLNATATDPVTSATVAGTFDYVPAAGSILTAGTKILSVTFNPNVSTAYSSVAASVTLIVIPGVVHRAQSYTLTGPSSGAVNATSSVFTITPNDNYVGTITPSATGAGTFSPTSLTWSGTSTPKTFTYTPTTSGARTIRVTCNPPIAPLLQSTDMTYVGGFRLPSGSYGTGPAPVFDYGGTAITYNPEHNSLFIVGHDYDQAIAEVSIPSSIVNSSNISNLTTCTVLQNFFRPLLSLPFNPFLNNPSPTKIGGLQVFDGKLVGSCYVYYDGEGTAKESHFLFDSTNLATANITGLFQLGTQGGGLVGGFMSLIPDEWRADLGNPCHTGLTTVPITGRTSSGPAAFGFNPATLAAAPVANPDIPYVYYPLTHSTLGTIESNPPTMFNGNTLISGVVFVPGTRSVLYFGSVGLGLWYYGGNVEANDYNRLPKGSHSVGGEYGWQVWAYDALDFMEAKNGQKNAWDVVPYTTWVFTMPHADGAKIPGGAAFDPTSRRVYFSEKDVDAVEANSSKPIIQVFQLPAAPTQPSVVYTASNPVIFSDNFTRADNVTLGAPWVLLQGNWGITSNRARCNGSGGYDSVAVDASASDVTVTTTVSTLSANAAIVFRATDVLNFLNVTITPTSMTINRRVGGTVTAIGTAYSGTFVSGDTISVTCVGSGITCYQNGVLRRTETSTFNQTATKHGLMQWFDPGSRYSAFSVEAASVAASSYTLTGPTAGVPNVTSANFTVTPNGVYTGTITPASTGSGAFSPTSLTWSATSGAKTFTYTPNTTSGSPHGISTTASPALGTNPAAVLYTVASSYTTTGAGTDWNTAANWTPSGPPVAGAAVVLNHPMTIASGTSAVVGTSVIGQTVLTINAALTVASGGSLTLRGNVLQATGVTVTGNGAGQITFDSSLANPTSTSWTWQIGTTTPAISPQSGYPLLQIVGTSGARFRVSSTPGGGPGRFIPAPGASGTGGVDAVYCDMIRIGDASNPAVKVDWNVRSPVIHLDHCTLYRCGILLALLGSSGFGGVCSVTNCCFAGSLGNAVGGFPPGQPFDFSSFGNANVSGSTLAFTNCDSDTLVVYNSGGWTVSGNTYRHASGAFNWTTSSYVAQTAGPYSPNNLSLTGPLGGAPNVVSATFTVTMLPSGTTAASIVVTPTVTGITGSFTPTTRTLATGTPSATFTFTPTSSGTGLITLPNTGVEPGGNGGVLLPDPRTYISSSVATLYTLDFPVHNYGIATWPSDPFTVAIPNGTTLPAPVTITPLANGSNTGFTPSTVTLSTVTPSATFTFTPAAAGVSTISCSNSASLTNPATATYTAYRSFAVAKAGVWTADLAGTATGQLQGGHYYSNTYASPSVLENLDGGNHYDPLSVYYQVRDYTGDSTFGADINTARYQTRDLYLVAAGTNAAGYHTFSRGLRYDWERTGDVRSRDAGILFGFVNVWAANWGASPNGFSWTRSREVAFAILAQLDAEKLGLAHRTQCEVNASWQLSYVNQALASPPPFYMDGTATGLTQADPCLAVQPFMAGLTMRSLIAYWDAYRHNPSTTVITSFGINKSQADIVTAIPGKIKEMLDYLRAYNWFARSFCFPYADRNETTLSTNPACASVAGTYDMFGTPYAAPALNPVIAHNFAWYALFSGDQAYLRDYEEVFIGATGAGEVTGVAATSTQKQYNQQFGLNDFFGIKYRDRFLNPGSWPAATAYTLAISDATSGRANQLSGRFTVALVGSQVSLANPVTITPSDGGRGGTFLPATVNLTTDWPSTTFRYAPAAASAGTNVPISCTNDGGLANPAAVTYGVTTVAPLATGYTVTAPTVSNGPTEWSPDWVLALTPAGSVPPRAADATGGIVPLQIHYPAGASSSPLDYLWLSGDKPSTTFQIRPGTTSPVTISLGPPQGQGRVFGSDPAAVVYTSAAANIGYGYTLRGPTTGSIGNPVSFTVSTLDNLFSGAGATGTFTVTFSDGAGGVFIPPTVGLNNGFRSGTVQYTPTSGGVRSIGVANSGPAGTSLVNPPAILFLAGNPFLTDAGTASEAFSLKPQVRATDGGTAVEVTSIPNVVAKATDSGTVIESGQSFAELWSVDPTFVASPTLGATSVEAVDFDSAVWSEFGPTLAADVTDLDSGSATDQFTTPVSTETPDVYFATDSGTGTDYTIASGSGIAVVVLPQVDQVAGSEFVGTLALNFGASDSAVAVDSAGTFAVLVGSDSGVWSESILGSATFRAVDSAVALPEVVGTTAGIIIGVDSGHWSESVLGSATFRAVDSGASTDKATTPVSTETSVSYAAIDFGAGVEFLGRTAAVVRSYDMGLSFDSSTMFLRIGASDSGTAVENTGAFTPSRVATDSGTGIDQGEGGIGFTFVDTNAVSHRTRHRYFAGLFRRG